MNTRFVAALKILATLVAVLCVVFLIIRTVRWPVTGDAALMHYVVFATRSGVRPYVGIADVNFPGAYAPDWLLTGLFHSIDLAWRLYDFGLLALVGIGMSFIATGRNRFAGLWSGCMFAAIHARDGIEQAGQRDLLCTALVMFAVVCAMKVRQNGAWLHAALFGCLVGSATIVKPSFACFLILVFFCSSRRLGAVIFCALSSFLLPLILCGCWLFLHGSLHSFYESASVLAPFHAGLGRLGLSVLLHNAISPISILVGIWVLAEVFAARKWSSEGLLRFSLTARQRLLAGGLLCAFLSYLIQGKGFPYQRYPFLAFLLIIITLRLTAAMETMDVRQLGGIAAVAWSCFVLIPGSVIKASRYDWPHNRFVESLEGDLSNVSGNHVSGLSGKVLCVDSVSGCLETLYRLKLLNSSRVMYDEFLFQPDKNEAVKVSRQDFSKDIERMPQVVVVTSTLFPSGPDHFAKLGAWPEFEQWLDRNYVVKYERDPMPLVLSFGRPFRPGGYRLYIRKPALSK